jgi:hypothetical protein
MPPRRISRLPARQHQWILSIDADEELTAELAAEIAALKSLAPDRASPRRWTMPRLARYLGRWIRHSGWYPDRKVRLYHRERGAWQGEYVHESVQVAGAVGQLNAISCTSPAIRYPSTCARSDRYTTLAAQAVVASGKDVPCAGWLSIRPGLSSGLT